MHKISIEAIVEIKFVKLKDLSSIAGDPILHRNDHYLFIVIESGEGFIKIDFEERYLESGSAIYILPGQAHHKVFNGNACGWLIKAKSVFLSKAEREIFEEQLTVQSPLTLNDEDFLDVSDVLKILMRRYQRHETNSPTEIQRIIFIDLLRSFTGIIAYSYAKNLTQPTRFSRKKEISRDFRKLLKSSTDLRRPAQFANNLNISANYLNEVIKSETGKPVTFWIMNERMMQAKRLLFQSSMTVKEIGYSLGYDNINHFYSLFKAYQGLTPSDFRQKYRK